MRDRYLTVAGSEATLVVEPVARAWRGGIVPVRREGEAPQHVTTWEPFAESRIREAIERGDFANVPGAGRPLDLGEENPFAGDMEVAYRILRRAGGAPLCIELGRAIDDGLESLTALVVTARSGPCEVPGRCRPPPLQ